MNKDRKGLKGKNFLRLVHSNAHLNEDFSDRVRTLILLTQMMERFFVNEWFSPEEKSNFG